MTLGDCLACLRQSEWRAKIKNEKERAKISRSFVGCVMHTHKHARTHTHREAHTWNAAYSTKRMPCTAKLESVNCCLLSLALQKSFESFSSRDASRCVASCRNMFRAVHHNLRRCATIAPCMYMQTNLSLIITNWNAFNMLNWKCNPLIQTLQTRVPPASVPLPLFPHLSSSPTTLPSATSHSHSSVLHLTPFSTYLTPFCVVDVRTHTPKKKIWKGFSTVATAKYPVVGKLWDERTT